jgi:hypothetical protein
VTVPHRHGGTVTCFPKERVMRRILLGATLIAGLLVPAVPAQAAGEQVNIWLTTTNDADGVNVTRGLQQQSPARSPSPSTKTFSTNRSRAAARRSPTRRRG